MVEHRQLPKRNPWKDFARFLAFLLGGLIVLFLLSGCGSMQGAKKIDLTEMTGQTGNYTCRTTEEVFEDPFSECPEDEAIAIYDAQWIEKHMDGGSMMSPPYALGPDSVVIGSDTVEGDIGPQMMYGPNGEILPYPSEGPILTVPVN